MPEETNPKRQSVGHTMEHEQTSGSHPGGPRPMPSPSGQSETTRQNNEHPTGPGPEIETDFLRQQQAFAGLPAVDQENLQHPTQPQSRGFTPEINPLKVHVKSVYVDGLSRTKQDFIDPQLKAILNCKTFGELMTEGQKVAHRLEGSGCFRSVSTSANAESIVSDGVTEIDVVFHVVERGRLGGSASTQVGANDGSLNFAIVFPNILGSGENVTLNHSIGSSTGKSTNLSFVRPYFGFPSTNLWTSFNLQKIKTEFGTSGYYLNNSEGQLDLTWSPSKFPPDSLWSLTQQSLQWIGSLRTLGSLSKSTAFEVREQAGDSFKSALRYLAHLDTRGEELVFPRSGISLKNTTELAGGLLGGDASFLKSELEFQVNKTILHHFVIQGVHRLGCLFPYGHKETWRVPSSNIHDNFFLGGPSGPQTLRGFTSRGIGPRSGGNSLGGQAYWSTGLHLYSPMPFTIGNEGISKYFRAHGWLNAGGLLDGQRDGNGDHLFKDFRASIGLGLACKVGQTARIELNYCFPLRFSPKDRIVRGIQLGFGIEFL